MEVSGQVLATCTWNLQNRMLGGPQSVCRQSLEERNVFPLSETRPQFLCHPARSLATVLISLSQLL